MVDAKGCRTPMASCTLPVSEGMEINTHSPEIEKTARPCLRCFYPIIMMMDTRMDKSRRPNSCIGSITTGWM
ncbi:hypothetical protein [Candidatus Villigracilis saccharophilus]|uniref:hypothetical protein n=1 Tax=Candidatus Villigracilis saccharophilus TaxID=3140684 RepID=UPI0031F04B98